MTKGHKVVFFDFDRTLIDTDLLKTEQTRRIARITSLSEKQVTEGMRLYIESLTDHFQFNPGGYANFLADLYSISSGDVMKVYLSDSSYISYFVFPEVPRVLTDLKENGWRLGIFSSAVFEHQLHKLKNSGVMKFFEENSIIIHPRKLTPEIVNKVPEGAYVIDDDIDIAAALKRHHAHVIPIWCNRKTNEEHPTIKTVHNLSQLLRWINTL